MPWNGTEISIIAIVSISHLFMYFYNAIFMTNYGQYLNIDYRILQIMSIFIFLTTKMVTSHIEPP